MEADYGTTTHFALLGLEPSFDVDLQAVDAAYRDLQRRLHPDHFAQAGGTDLELAQAHSARVNEAVKTLRVPLRRAHYLLELKGIKALEEDQRIEDMEMMMEVMEVSEEIADATAQGEIDRIAATNAIKMQSVEVELGAALSSEDMDSTRRLLERLQMLTRLDEKMKDWRAP